MNLQTGPPAGYLPVSDLTQDVRFAVTMSGGVSLAVWMGGVAREVNLLQQASNARVNAAQGPEPSGAGATDWDGRCRELYRKLLQVLDVRVTVDVLSGTSAGGINAALLGLSSAAGVDLARPARLVVHHGIHGHPAARSRGEEPALADAGRQGLVRRAGAGHQQPV